MRAWEFDDFGFDRLKLVEKAEPTPGPGQVLVRMTAWSLNYRDLLVIRGQYNPKLRRPMTPLSDGVGVVEAVGAGVTTVKVGQRVASCFFQDWSDGLITEARAKSALGGGVAGVAAEKVVFEAEGVVAVPEHLSDVESATLPCAGVTAWNAVARFGQVTGRDAVLIQGTGGVSLFALQFAKLFGAAVIGTSSQDEKLAKARTLGLDVGVNYRQTPDWGDKARQLANDVGVDLIVEVGGAGTLGQSFRAVRMAGKIALIGVLSGTVGEVNPLSVVMRSLAVQGIYVGSRAMFEEMNQAIAKAKLKPVVDRVFPFAELPAALAYQESGRHFGKVAVASC